ncbi:hypothetical protein PM082_010341 [Marasmius tenuissimus]|nr:hypothetical protein PM082_010341 [Marasmius tenuissimus]
MLKPSRRSAEDSLRVQQVEDERYRYSALIEAENLARKADFNASSQSANVKNIVFNDANPAWNARIARGKHGRCCFAVSRSGSGLSTIPRAAGYLMALAGSKVRFARDLVWVAAQPRIGTFNIITNRA